MAAYHPMKLKRKDLDAVNDDFSDFCLSSPACKIRRLDADLPPIIEEDEPELPLRFEQQPVAKFGVSGDAEAPPTGPVIEEFPPASENEERAIVLFEPVNTPLFHSPSKYVVDSNLISSIKGHYSHGSKLCSITADQASWGTCSNSSKPVEDEEEKGNECLSVIPWAPSQHFHHSLPPEASEKEASEPMDAEEMGAPMETIDNDANSGVQSVNGYIDPSRSNESLHNQWEQQHCMIPQPPHNTTTPVVWYR